MEMKKLMQCAGNISPQENGEFWMIAYTGRKMNLAGWDFPVVFDLKDIAFQKDSTPILFSHDRRMILGVSTEQYILQTEEVLELHGKTFVGPAVIMRWKPTNSETQTVSILENIRNGFPYEYSLGVKPETVLMIPEGEKFEANGTVFEGPLLVPSPGKILEVSICVFGACAGTQSFKAAQADDQGGFGMTKNVKTPPGNDPADTMNASQMNTPAPGENAPRTMNAANIPDLENWKKTMEAEQQETLRVSMIRTAAGMMTAGYSPIELDGAKFENAEAAARFAVKTNVSADEFQAACRKAVLDRPVGPAIHIQDKTITSEVMECALMNQVRKSVNIPEEKTPTVDKKYRHYGMEAWYSPKVREAADRPELRDLTLHGILDQIYFECHGHHYQGNRKSNAFFAEMRETIDTMKIRRAMNAAGSGPINLSYLWKEAAQKTVIASFNELPTTWQDWVQITATPDFRPQAKVWFGGDNRLAPLGSDGTIEIGTMFDESLMVRSDTFAKAYKASRQALYNDDLGAIVEYWNGIGELVPATIDEVAYGSLLNNFDKFFTAEKGNLLTGENSALSLESIEHAANLFENMVDRNGQSIYVVPDMILTGQPLRKTATQIYSESNPIISYLIGSGEEIRMHEVKNDFVGRYRPVISGYLSNTNLRQNVYKELKGKPFPNQSSTLWFMACSKASRAPFYLACVGGSPTPHIETFDDDPLTLGTGIKIYSDFNFNAGDTSLMIACTGN